jgi:hypothetical protein
MTLTRYRYTGPPSAASLRLGETQPLLDVRLHPGEPVELPTDHDYTRVLIALKHLQPLPTTAPASKTPKPQPPAKD